MVTAILFDGKSAQEKNVIVRRLGHQLIISDERQSEFSLNISDIDVQSQNGTYILSVEEIELHIQSSDYKSLKIKSSFLGNEKKVMMKYFGISFFIIIMTYFFHHPILKFLATLVPDSFFESTGKMIVETYRPKHCLNSEQDEAIKEIFNRLGSNEALGKTFIVKSPLVNAFVMPGNVIIIHDELIKQSPSAEALAGIIAHELGHIYGNHHKHALIKNYFIESLWSMIDKGTVAQIIKNIAQDLLTQEDELEADHLAIKSLRDQHINPMGVVAFFEHRKKVEHPVLRYLSFTHPDYDKRIAIFNQRYDSYPVLSPNKWEKLKQACQ